jgi:hydrogenase maturation protease
VTRHTRKKDVVLGLGNVLMSDEGIGVHLIERLSALKKKFPHVDFIDAGTAGMSILHLIANRRKAIIIDCAKMQTTPGTIRRFGPHQVESVKTLAHYSCHEADILQIVGFCRQLGQLPDEIVFFGIEPQTVAPGRSVSQTLAARINDYVDAVCKELTCQIN